MRIGQTLWDTNNQTWMISEITDNDVVIKSENGEVKKISPRAVEATFHFRPLPRQIKYG